MCNETGGKHCSVDLIDTGGELQEAKITTWSTFVWSSAKKEESPKNPLQLWDLKVGKYKYF